MAQIKYLIYFFIFYYLIVLSSEYTDLKSISFKDTEQSLRVQGTGEFKVIANYIREEKDKFLYIYPKYYKEEMYLSKAIIKIYFKEFKKEDENANYLESDYSTLDFNSGLFIKLDSLNYDQANIFIIAYDNADIVLQYKYSSNIFFPSFIRFNNFQLNQFTLPKGKSIKINFGIKNDYNEYLIILSKSSLRNIEVSAINKNKDLNIANLYPNGFSIFLDKKNIDPDYPDIFITINNKNIKDEIILLSYMHHFVGDKIETFPYPLVNGYQIYLEGNMGKLYYLPNVENNQMFQYFTYQVYSKELIIGFTYNNNVNTKYYHISEYNSMIYYNSNTNGNLIFDFQDTPQRTALYFQYIDYNDNKLAQKSLQPLVTGSPKSMIIPEKKSIYHFLPIDKESKNIHYYLRPKSSIDNFYISFKTCSNYPEECTFSEKGDKIPLIENIGLWYTQTTNKDKLQLIYVYCESECAYDILMIYDNDPLFMFPESNYTKFIGNEGQDILILPIFEYLSKNDSIYIDLTVLSGKAELSLYTSMDNIDKESNKLNYNYEKIGKKQSYIINNQTITKASYYKKDIFAVIKGKKNTFYHLIYGSGSLNNKIFDNNRVIIETISVVDEDSQNKKSFTFINQKEKEKLYISITTPTCKSRITIDGKNEQNRDNHHLISVEEKGQHTVKVYLIADNLICKNGYEGEIILYSYNMDNSNVLLSENTLVNTSYIGKEITFKHIFKPSMEKNADNSFNIEIERLSVAKLKFQYKLERISFNISESKESNISLSSYILSKKNNLISSNQINSICGSLSQNEICSLSLIFKPDSISEQISFIFYLNKNGNNYARHLIDETLINSVNPNSVQYYYIDVFKAYDTEILLNSYGQDLTYYYQIKGSREEEGIILPFDVSQFKPGSNNHKIIIETSEYCSDTFCRIYLGVGAIKNKLGKEVPTIFKISYLFKEKTTRKTEVKLPINYFTQYTLDKVNDIKEITYSIQTYDTSDLLLELYIIKENENDDNSELYASFSGGKFSSKEGTYHISGNKPGKMIITIEPSSSTVKSTFKFRVSSIGKSINNQIIQILPYSSEKCEIKQKSTCFYFLDLSPDNEAEKVYFYIPESENAYISIDELEYGNIVDPKSSFSLEKDLKISSKDKLQRSNWFEYIIPKEKNSTLLIKVASQVVQDMNLTLYSSFYNKPEVVTLNHGEKKIFTIESNLINEMKINIKKTSFNYNKYKINIHAVKGDGVFKVLGQLYPLGINGNNKENIIIIIDEVDKDLEIIVNNTKDETGVEFTFTIDYTITTINHLFNELKPSIINSYKFIKPTDTKLTDIVFYMKLNSTEEIYHNVNMNIKIYSNISTFDVKSYIVDEEFIKEKSKDIKKSPENPVGEIITFIQGGNVNGGELTFSKLKIESKEIKEKKKDNKQLYIYITFKQKESKDNKVKIDIYPYDTSNNLPLVRNELFIEKLEPETSNYQLLLVKSDFSSNDMIIEYLSPLSNKYTMAIEHDQNIKEYFAYSNETDLIKEKDNFEYFGKNKISLDINHSQDSKNLRYLLFNVFISKGEIESKEDLFIFKYRNQNDEISDIYNDGDKEFNVEGTTANITFTLDVINPKHFTGNTILIFNAYNENDIKDLNLKEENMALYLFFSKKPIFSMYKALDKNQVKKSIEKSFTTNDIKSSGTYYFTCVSVIEDNEREEYLGYKAVRLTLETSDTVGGLLDYMKNHIFATVLMIIIILFVLGMMVNMCKNEKKDQVSINVGSAGKIMDEL